MIENPKERPHTEEEAKANFKAGLEAFDKAEGPFLAAAPKDPRVWQLKLFAIKTASKRSMVGLEPRNIEVYLEDILKSAEAEPSIKAEASAVRVYETDISGNEDAWIKLAEEHLEKFGKDAPRKLNLRIMGMLESTKITKDLKTKPMELKFLAVDGREVDLAKMRDKVVLIDFWATWCGPCVAELPKVLGAYEKYHAQGFEIVGISLDENQEKLREFVKSKGMSWPQFFDGKGWENEISKRYGITSIPAMWLVNKKGMVVDSQAREDLAAKVEKLLAE